ncbi:phage integrase N-terminal SAM-like domain-containing protein [Cupriavidus sp. D39]|uniref:phage integrase N-terminal SAM-like domain-containing protein n=1 Tax=Cupriavidus sp. D39 TaxID=2997877 RepID=UPI003B63C110
MSVATPAISPLRQRMIEDMRMRKLADKSQSQYIHAVCQFTAFLGRSPHTASIEDLRRYQLHLVDHGISPVSLNAAIMASMTLPTLWLPSLVQNVRRRFAFEVPSSI